MTPGTPRRISSTPQKQPPASTATSVRRAPATAERVPLGCSVISSSGHETAIDFFNLPQRLEPRAEVAHQELRLFPCREVPALVVLVVEQQVVVGALGPTPRSLVDLLRKDADGGRHGDVVVVEEGALVFHVETSAGHARVRPPGESAVVA